MKKVIEGYVRKERTLSEAMYFWKDTNYLAPVLAIPKDDMPIFEYLSKEMMKKAFKKIRITIEEIK